MIALADGVGGHASGEVASALAIAELMRLDGSLSEDDPLARLREATDRANKAIAHYAAENPASKGMSTTLTAMLFSGDRLALIHIGDSRGYLLREESLTQITKDETFVQALVDQGHLSPDEASVHPQRSIVLNALTGRPIQPTLTTRELRVKDRYLICSDGVSDFLPTKTLADALVVEENPQRCTDQLTQLALQAGSNDNVSCVVAHVTDDFYGPLLVPQLIESSTTTHPPHWTKRRLNLKSSRSVAR